MTGADRSRLRRLLTSFRRDRRASSAVEFALVATPFIFTLLAILQLGIFYMAQSSLDAGVAAEADTLNNAFYSQSTTWQSNLTLASLKTAIAAKSGGMVNASTLLVDLQPFSPTLTSAPVAIGSNPVSLGSAGTCTSQTSCGGTILALRAQASVTAFAPLMGSFLTIRSSVLVRRQGQ